jgi:16S rRNA pseudouridine516 synthase
VLEGTGFGGQIASSHLVENYPAIPAVSGADYSEALTAQAKVRVTGTSVLSDVLPSLHPEIQEQSRHNRPDHPVVFGQITITEGKKHQVRRMLKAVRCCVISLKRISIDSIALDESLKPGEWKPFFPSGR